MLSTIPIEMRHRDLDNSLYLAAVLAERGISSLAGFIDKLYKFLEKNDVSVLFFDKGFSNRAREDSYRRFAKNRPVVQMLYEGLLAGQPWEYSTEYFAPDRVSAYCAWGEAQAQFYRNHLPEEHHKKIHVTGTHFFDLLHPDRFHYYRNEEIERTVGKGFILINTRFDISSGLTYEDFKKLRPEQPMFMDPEKKLWNASVAYETALIDGFHSLALTLRQKFPDKLVVIRPHPTESIAYYEEKFADIPGVRVIQQGSVREWIYSADTVIHHACTTGIEASIAGRKSISYAPVLDRDLITPFFHDVSFQAQTEDEVVRAIQEGCPPTDSQVAQLRNVLDYIGYNGAERTADLIQAHAPESRHSLQEIDPVRRLYWWWRENRRDIKNSLLNREDSEAERTRRKWPHPLKKAEVIERLALLRRVMPHLPEVTVTEVVPECFLIVPVRK